MATQKDKSAGEPLRKITIATVYGKVDLKELLKDEKVAHAVCDVWGVATKAKPGESDFGAFVKFLGQFKAVNAKTGELFRAPVCLLPKFLEEELAGALGASDQPVEFAFRIAAKYDEKAATKYVYLAESMIEAGQSQAMSALEARLAKAVPALADKSKDAPAPGGKDKPKGK